MVCSVRRFLCFLSLATLLLPARAQTPVLDGWAALQASQAVLGKTLGEHALLDREGRPLRLSSLRGKPLLVSFIYTGCFQVCPANSRSLLQAVQALEARFGLDGFNVISIGFNQPADSPQAMKAFALQHGIDRPQWNFLSAPAASVDALTRDFGFSYAATPAGFDHVLQVTLVDAQGRIARQVYGDEVPADALGEPLKQLLLGAPLPQQSGLDDLINRVRILCTVYDPKTGRYRVDYSLAIEVAGGLSFVLAILLYFFNEWRGQRRRSRV
ncbi:SCO family protein [Roseateles oligotrophus]|uniref:SCO family protein n=1 Tax=Roseateles oligotrophus TaxID=1769250 RepID=A0ABT2YBF6_9BURK|nr:SCO family protein [Roseateles oligotrophus]MCV2367052.1 SCO family protein [Roseateles oligotrophus]